MGILNFDPIILARVQFAFTISFHIIFPAFTIGLASWLAVTEGLWFFTGKKIYREIYQMWIKIFAVCFGMGVVSGVVISYQFGTNWSIFSDKVGNIIGPLLGYEVLTAFFLEASFLGIMLFGWGRVSKAMHFTATCIVAFGTLFSGFWILAANSWMQTPKGYEIGEHGVLYPTSWIDIIFNPSFPFRFLHMIIAAYLTTAFAIGGIAAYYLICNKYVHHAKVMFGMAMIMAIFIAPIQPFIGDMHGLNTVKHQPAKVAAMEGAWDTEKGAPLRLFAVPNAIKERNDYEITIPHLSSLILTHSWNGEVKGLKDWPKQDRPPVTMVFFSFRVMVGIGLLMMLTGLIAIILYFRQKLFTSKWFHYWCFFMTPSGFIAILTGWFVTEIGRQPFTVYGVIRTADSVSPVITEHIAVTLIGFIITYTIMFGAAMYYIIKLIAKGPQIIEKKEEYYEHSMEAHVIKNIISKKRGDKC